MWKPIVAGTAALAIIAGTSLVYAQQSGRLDRGKRWQPNAEDVRAFGEARLASLKAGLTLTPDQDMNWPATSRIPARPAQRRASSCPGPA